MTRLYRARGAWVHITNLFDMLKNNYKTFIDILKFYVIMICSLYKFVIGGGIITIQQEYYTVAEAAKILRVSENTIYTWVAKGEIQSTKLGDVIRIPYEAIYPHKENNNPAIKQ